MTYTTDRIYQTVIDCQNAEKAIKELKFTDYELELIKIGFISNPIYFGGME